jgi:hypothetical protein
VKTVAEISGEIIQRKCPVLVVDACAVLDLARAALPDRASARIYAHAMKIVQETEASRCAIVQTSITPREIADHMAETLASVRKFSEQAEIFLNEINLMGSSLGFPKVPVAFLSSTPIITSVERFISRLLACSMTLPETDAALARAMRRANARRAPAANKRGEYKDCQVVEELIELAGGLRAGGLGPEIVLLSSNQSDFCEKGKLHPDLDSDFGPHQIRYAAHWDQARHLLGIAAP